MLNKSIKFLIENKLVAFILLCIIIGGGILVAPFDWKINAIPRDPVAVDAIPDIGENQQIVFTKWEGQSPQDIEDQITYPLTTYLMGIPGVKTVRSNSMFGFSSIYIIFDEDIDFYWSRSRIVEKLNSIPKGLLPEGVQPSLGPDATGLGQIYWYTLEGRDEKGNATGGWDLHELRSIQDYYVKFALSSAKGVSEVASIGGYIQEYQIDVNPEKLRQYNIPLKKIVKAVKNSNKEIGAQTLEINQVEYLIRGLGYIKSIEDIENAVVEESNYIPIRIKDVAQVTLGPASRRGILDKEGAEVAGGIIIARYGANPMEVIQNVKIKINELSNGLPSKTLKDGTVSKLTIVPFYDRTELINETLDTLNEALFLEILITVLVIVIMVMNLRASGLISALLPIAVLMVFIGMKLFSVDANIVALSGIAIAIGTMVDVGVILSENIIRYMDQAKKEDSLSKIIYKATSEVSGAIVTAVMTTIVSFIPVFTMEAAEGKLFTPLAYTKTMALIASVIVALWIIPPFSVWVFGIKIPKNKIGLVCNALFIILGGVGIYYGIYLGLVLIIVGILQIVNIFNLLDDTKTNYVTISIVAGAVIYLLSKYWRPLGFQENLFDNFIFVAIVVLGILGFFILFRKAYIQLLKWALNHKVLFLLIPFFIILFGVTAWLGIEKITGTKNKTLIKEFPGIGKEFMPALNEGSFLLMPTTLPHAGIVENKKVLQQLDRAVANIPEIETVVGKAGRAESAIDPAPLSMFENVILYKPEFVLDENRNPQRFKVNEDGTFLLKNKKKTVQWGEKVNPSELIPDEDGEFFRNWRSHIHSPDDIWKEITQVTQLPGVTSAPKLQPIETRLVMLQTGMRAPMGIKIKGQNLKEIEAFGLQLEAVLKQVNGVKKEAVFADRIVGKPYLLIDIDREAIARYGLSVEEVQQTLSVAVGGMPLTYTVEGRERYPVRVRYPREMRSSPDDLEKIYIPNSKGVQIPLKDLVKINYEKGPQAIKSEDTFLVGYVLFDKEAGEAEVNVVEKAQKLIQSKIDSKELTIPHGISYSFTGTYENQIRAEKKLSLIVPVALLIIFLILYFQFKKVSTSLMIFVGIAVAFSGGFIMIWLYGQEWFLNFSFLGQNIRELFQIRTINLSVAVWVGFIALFGIATDDGVVIATYLTQVFDKKKPQTQKEIREAVIEAGQKRIRPCLMTTATTLLALLPILTSTGRGSDIMIPMAIPSFGGMLVALITLFVVPVLYSWNAERKIKNHVIEKDKVII
ncbi:MAG: efflux RND transporter permease subunit [Flavobacteriales bacterium]